MSALRSLCFSLVIGIFLVCNISIAQETESTDTMLKKGLNYESQKDYQQAMQWYLKAADGNNALAMFLIADFYENGKGVKQNNQQAAFWFQKGQEALK